jgi:hypothetical protein
MSRDLLFRGFFTPLTAGNKLFLVYIEEFGEERSLISIFFAKL